MIFKFLLLSDEVDDFRREIEVDADSTFLDLHKAIIQSAGYKDEEMASFFICSDNWEKEKEITIVEMDTSSEEDSYVMADCTLNDFLEDEKQKLMYVYDYMTERAFFIELSEIITGKTLTAPKCTLSEGSAPVQFMEFEDMSPVTGNIDLGENFYGDDEYDMDELDSEGFDGLDGDAAEMSDEDFR